MNMDEKAEGSPVESTTDVAIKGEAKIQSQFLTTKDAFHGFVDSKWKSYGAQGRNEDAKEDTEGALVEEPEAKKTKFDTEETNKNGKADKKTVAWTEQVKASHKTQRV